MLVVLDLDDEDVQAVVEAVIDQLPRRPLHVGVFTNSAPDAAAIRRTMGWDQEIAG